MVRPFGFVLHDGGGLGTEVAERWNPEMLPAFPAPLFEVVHVAGHSQALQILPPTDHFLFTRNSPFNCDSRSIVS